MVEVTKPEDDFVLVEAKKWLAIQPRGFTSDLVRKLVEGYESLAKQLSDKEKEAQSGQVEDSDGTYQTRFDVANSERG